MYIVEIRRKNDDLADPMAQFRTWLDNKGIQPTVFRLSLVPQGTIFRFEFRIISEADAFAQTFAGQVIGVEGSSDVAA